MRVLILGGTGLLGQALVEEWTLDEVAGVGSKEADLRDVEQLRSVFSDWRPDWTVLAAAYTDVDGCEKNPTLARAINTQGAANTAIAAREFGSRLLMVSTDYVFDGRSGRPYEVDDPVCPINVYGQSKADGEDAVRRVLPEALILRTAWLFGTHGRCFPKTILALAEKQKELAVVDDQRGCPTFNRDLARALIRLVRAAAKGTVHVTNALSCSWFEFALELLRAAGRSDVVVRSIVTEDAKRSARRPRYSVLSHASLKPYGLSMRTWQQATRDYLREDFAQADSTAKG